MIDRESRMNETVRKNMVFLQNILDISAVILRKKIFQILKVKTCETWIVSELE
jgi:hypothetical protein